MPLDQDVGRSHTIKNDDSSFDSLEEFKCLGTALKNQNPIQEEIKRRLMSGTTCYPSVQNLLSLNFGK